MRRLALLEAAADAARAAAAAAGDGPGAAAERAAALLDALHALLRSAAAQGTPGGAASRQHQAHARRIAVGFVVVRRHRPLQSCQYIHMYSLRDSARMRMKHVCARPEQPNLSSLAIKRCCATVEVTLPGTWRPKRPADVVSLDQHAKRQGMPNARSALTFVVQDTYKS